MFQSPVDYSSGATRVNDQEYEVTGILSPDATGSYLNVGEYNGKPYCRRSDSGYYIWWNSVADWVISSVLGGSEPARWMRADPAVEGVYQPIGEAQGEATVTET